MIKAVWTAFRDNPGRNCGHYHITKQAALKCASKEAKKYGGKWYVTRYKISH